jgi:predicted RNase H-like HicB family nuclease
MKLVVVIEPCEEGGCHAWVPSLPGCHSESETEAEVLHNIQEAIELYLAADDEQLPVPAR